MRHLLAAVAGGIALVWANVAGAVPCTDGVDCFCDCIRHATAGMPAACGTKYGITTGPTTNVLVCEDFEAVTLYDGRGTGTQGLVGPGAGASACTEGNDNANCLNNTTPPLYGPWYDNSTPTFRGRDSYWYSTYGQSSGGNCSFQENHPDNPTLGLECGSPGSGATCATAEWRADNAWGGNDRACIDIVRDGEFNDEDPDITSPSTIPDGQQAIGHRVAQGDGLGEGGPTTAGFHGVVNFGHPVTEMGWTQWLAYPNTLVASHILDSQWKHNEGGPTNNGWPMGNYQNGYCTQDRETFPYGAFFWSPNSAAANALEATTTKTVGEIQSNGSLGAYMCPLEAQYKQSRDFPFGTWGCFQSHITGLGTTNARHRAWFNGTLIVDIQNINASAYYVDQFWNGFSWNNYSNYNQFVGQATAKVAYRYEDNVIVREGTPVSCATIGFTGAITPEPSAGEVNLSTATPSVTEGNGGGFTNFTITVNRSVGTTGAVSAVVYATAGGTAEAYTDFTPDAGTVSWADGETGSKTVIFQVTADTLDEANETFTVTLATPSGGVTIGSTSLATATITDDDATPSLTISDDTVAEGTGGSVNSHQFSVDLSAASGRTVTVLLSTSNGTATNGADFSGVTNQTVTFTTGQINQLVPISVIGDALDEANETYTATLSSPTNATLADATATATITDDDNPPTVTLNPGDSAVGEAGETHIVNAVLSAASGRDVTVNLSYSGTATNTTDYTRSTSAIVIPAGSTSGSVTITGVQDTLDEVTETIIVDISSVTNGTESGTQQVTINLTDDDLPPTVTLTRDNATIAEAGGVSTLTATLSAASSLTVTVTLSFSNSTAAGGGIDYTASGTTITINAGSTSGTRTVTAVADTTDEPTNLTVVADIASVTNGTENGTQQVTVTILDDDDVTPTTANPTKLNGNVSLTGKVTIN